MASIASQLHVILLSARVSSHLPKTCCSKLPQAWMSMYVCMMLCEGPVLCLDSLRPRVPRIGSRNWLDECLGVCDGCFYTKLFLKSF